MSPVRVSADSSLKGSVESFGRVPVKPRYMNPNSAIVSFHWKLNTCLPSVNAGSLHSWRRRSVLPADWHWVKSLGADLHLLWDIYLWWNYYGMELCIKTNTFQKGASRSKVLFPMTVTQALLWLAFCSVYIRPVHNKRIYRAAVPTGPLWGLHATTYNNLCGTKHTEVIFCQPPPITLYSVLPRILGATSRLNN